MNHAELHALGARFRQRRDRNRVDREKVERSKGLLTFTLGLIGGIVVVAVLIFATR